MEVTDGSPQHPVLFQQFPPDAESGRGLHLVGAVTDKWGVSPTPGNGKTAWFETAISPPAT
ncbi:hypothetical protein GCM10023080_080920 [Streptomyces pseudoechinosporeus]